MTTTPGTLRMVRLLGLHCERCEYEWVPRRPDTLPRVCPRCKSPYWDRPRRVIPVSSGGGAADNGDNR